MHYREVQAIAKQTMQYAAETIHAGMTLLEVRALCEQKLLALGATSFWYWDIGAFVFSGKETMRSVSGKQYQTADRVIAEQGKTGSISSGATTHRFARPPISPLSRTSAGRGENMAISAKISTTLRKAS